MTYVDLDDDVDSVDAAMDMHATPVAHAHHRMPKPEMMKPAETVEDHPASEEKAVECWCLVLVLCFVG